ncbi:HU family DNA-binding protein [Bacteroides pyogenes]|uniref:HU family DNA-binding protein n=1 Tax=Bacteroides pyogenes TaxID=310300 RepID=UPI003B429AB2
MAFFKKVKQKINGKWYPRAVTVGKPVTTDQVADRLSQISTVSRADTFAVLKDLGSVLVDYMAQGRTVKLEGVGTFYYTANASGKGADTAEEVSAKQITGVRVRFIPESTRTTGNKIATRSLVSNEVFWEEWGGTTSQPGGVQNNPGDGGTPSPGGGSGGHGEAPDPAG